MFVTVDLATNQIGLDEPDDCTRFHVEVRNGDPGAGRAGLGDALAAIGRLADDDHAWIDIAGVRTLAEGRVGVTWAADFDSMVGYAASKGWLDEAKTAIQAHLEWG